MASPQIENGYTKVANELLEALCCTSLSGHEWNVVHAIMRKTYGYNKKEDWVTNTQIMLLTGQSQQKVSLAKKKLVAKNIVIENGNKISINKDYEKWIGVTENGNKSYRKRQQKLPKTVNTKDNIKKKEISEQSSEELKANQKEDMGWQKISDDYEEGVVDIESGVLSDPEEETRAELQELNRKIRHNLSLVEEIRGLKFGKGKDMNFHVKIYRAMLENGWTHQRLIEEFIELINTDFWKQKKKTGEYPGMNTLQSYLRNKQPS